MGRGLYTRQISCILIWMINISCLYCGNAENAKRGRKSMALLILLFWVILNGRVTWEIMGLGGAITALTMIFLCRFCDWSLKKEMGLYRAVPRILAFLATVIWEIVKANLALCRIVYRGRPEPYVRVIHTELKTRMGKMLLANAITLTPGTVTLACRGNALTVHCLAPKMAQGLDDLVFERRLLKVEEALHG